MPPRITDAAGKVWQTVSTNDERAAAFYHQGLAWFHSYGFIEAIRAFHQALRYDPNLAMAELGLARSYFYYGDHKKASEHYIRASALSSHGDDRERRYITARLLQWDAINADDEASESEKLDAYRAALDELLRDYPDDPELWIARGNAEEDDPEAKGQEGGESTIPYYEHALALDANHPGAHHYLTHTYENLRRYDDAVRHAAIYARLAPGAPHAQHMYGHVLPRVGDWEGAVRQFEKAAALETEYYENEHIPPHEDWHHIHNLTLLGWAYERVGRMDDAKRVLKEAFELPVAGRFNGLFDHVNYPGLLIRLGAYSEAIEAARRLTETAGDGGKAVGWALIGQALFEMGRIEDARATLEQAESALDALRKDVEGTPTEWASSDAETYVETLRALLNVRDEDPSVQYVGQKTLRDLVKRLTSGASFDGWGEGYLRVEGILASLKRDGRTALAEELRAIRESAEP